jgi:hypothetical protein
MIVDVPVVGKIGYRLTSYFSEFGEFEGKISDTRSGRTRYAAAAARLDVGGCANALTRENPSSLRASVKQNFVSSVA